MRKRQGFIQRRVIRFSSPRLRALFPKITPARLRVWQRLARPVIAEDVTYLSDELQIKGFLVYPRKAGKYPCIIFNRGGEREFGALSPRHIYNLFAPLAAAGYVVIASQYRGNGGSEGREEYGGGDLRDVLNLIPLLRQLRFADATKIGMYGWSRGGMTTYMILKKLRSLRAAVVGGGEADLVSSERYRPPMKKVHQRHIRAKTAKEFTRELQRRSAVYWPEKIAPKTPLLILHGAADWRVRPETSIRLVEKLVQLHRPVRFVLYEGADHGIHEHSTAVDREVLGWFDRFLKGSEGLPNTKPHGE